jgi:hypothetical protein
MTVPSLGSSPVFYLPERPRYTIVASAIDAARYAVAATVPAHVGANAQSFLMDVEAKPVRTGGRLIQGIGYCANAPYGAGLLHRFGRFAGRADFIDAALRLADHSIRGGYLDHPDIPVRLYRDAETGEFFDQVEARNLYFDIGHMAKAVHDIVDLAGIVDAAARSRIERLGRRFGAWLLSTPRTSSGWLPRRLGHDLKPYGLARLPPGIGPDTAGGLRPADLIAERSGAGLFSVACMARLDQLGFVAAEAFLRETCDAFVERGGFFGSTNTDTADAEECVSFALAFRILLDLAGYLKVERYRAFAYEVCLPGLRQFWLPEDLNGQATKGLLRLSETYSSACFWECAEAAFAYLRAGDDSGSSAHVLQGLTILRGIARNHFGPLGFVPSELDWDGRMHPDAHLEPGMYGPRAVTHPYMNNLWMVAPTLFYLETLAWRVGGADVPRALIDAQGNRLWPM